MDESDYDYSDDEKEDATAFASLKTKCKHIRQELKILENMVATAGEKTKNVTIALLKNEGENVDRETLKKLEQNFKQLDNQKFELEIEKKMYKDYLPEKIDKATAKINWKTVIQSQRKSLVTEEEDHKIEREKEAVETFRQNVKDHVNYNPWQDEEFQNLDGEDDLVAVPQPKSILCPLTLIIMAEPYRSPCSHIFDKHAIRMHLVNNADDDGLCECPSRGCSNRYAFDDCVPDPETLEEIKRQNSGSLKVKKEKKDPDFNLTQSVRSNTMDLD